MAWQRKDLLGLADLSAEETETLLRSALSFKGVFQRSVKKFPTLRGKTVVNLFYEPSTRTHGGQQSIWFFPSDYPFYCFPS
jgi:aspartate carbamoyltransferase catalytic subunit